MIEHACVLCAVYRRDAEPRTYERAHVDEGCRHRLRTEISSVEELFERLNHGDLAEVDDRVYAVRDAKGQLTGEVRRADPTSLLGGMAPTPARSTQPAVSGSRERQLPINPDVIDLLAPSRRGVVRDPEGDQVGRLSVATVLDDIVHDWRDELFPDKHLPPATVPLLTSWMLDRYDVACDRHPAIADHAGEIRQLRTALHGALGETEPLPEVMWGVLCRTEGCDDVSQLVRRPGSDYIECDACFRLYTEEEYREWTQLLARQVRPKGRRRATGLPEWATTTAAAAEPSGTEQM
ncbi:hypothetical protein [Micromonospora sp. NPDC047730]|uniref:hypothetical protein n=1 Tax=Micromonospora sp. NPDC047730 TaxID=3364253 RepID=UPI003720E2B8